MPLRAVLRLALVLVPAAMPSESVVGVNDLGDSPSTASYTNKQHKLAIDQGPLYVFLAFDKVYPPPPPTPPPHLPPRAPLRVPGL